MPLPLVTIVGRPNVGKSTLFNCLTKSRQALVADHAGLTRDLHYGFGKAGDRPYMLIDTGGLIDNPKGIEELMQQQAQIAIDAAAIILLVVDASDGLNVSDEEIAHKLRQLNKPVILVMNKSDRSSTNIVIGEFSRLGYQQTVSVSAAHNRGINILAQTFCQWLPKQPPEDQAHRPITVAIIGKPNVGKSTLTNQLLDSQRMIVADLPGTTRDSIRSTLEINGQNYELIDTAGIRRRKSVHQTVEKFSIIKALESTHQSHIVLLIINSQEGVSFQDLSIAQIASQEGKGVVVIFNKWDSLSNQQKNQFLNDWQRRAYFLNFAQQLKVSALKGYGVKAIIPAINQAYKACFSKLQTAEVNQVLQATLEHHPPQSTGSQRVKLRYAHLGGSNPPTIIIHGNSCQFLANSYKRYLENTFRQAFELYGTPIRLIFKTTTNPFAGQKQKNNQRQQKYKRRMKSITKK